MRTFAFSIFAAFGVATGAVAQNYSIDWFSIDGGGGTSTGGVYSVTGTIGQPDAGNMSGGTYSLIGGVLGIVAAVQSPRAPLPSLDRQPGAARGFLPKTAPGVVLHPNPR